MKDEQYYLEKYKPILYLHHKETKYPVLWEDYFKDINNKVKHQNQKSINKIPYYGFLKFDKDDFFLDIVYIFLYPNNKEHITIRINKYTEIIIQAFFYDYNKTRYLKDLSLCTHCHTLKVYVSLHNHFNFYKIKTFQFNNNKTSNKGLYWYPNKVIHIDKISSI